MLCWATTVGSDTRRQWRRRPACRRRQDTQALLRFVRGSRHFPLQGEAIRTVPAVPRTLDCKRSAKTAVRSSSCPRHSDRCGGMRGPAYGSGERCRVDTWMSLRHRHGIFPHPSGFASCAGRRARSGGRCNPPLAPQRGVGAASLPDNPRAENGALPARLAVT
jgi:hypothetical protein